MKTINWCCIAFENAYSRGSQRGHNVLFATSVDGIQFFLHYRSIDPEHMGALHEVRLPFPVSLVGEARIRFCPWCGRDLINQYRKQLERMPILDTPIGEGRGDENG
jgi:hypothetical protein